MAKKLRDIKPSPPEQENEEIDLRPPSSGKRKKTMESRNRFGKRTSPIVPVKDLSGGKDENYLYIKGKAYKPPRFLGNLLKIAVAGFAILFVINTVNVYYTGKQIQRELEAKAEEGYAFITEMSRFQEALDFFDEAIENFSKAESQLWFVSGYRSFLRGSDNMVYAANALLTGGRHLATAGGYFLEAIETFNKIPLGFVVQNVEGSEIDFSIAETLESGLEKIDLAIAEVVIASDLMNKIDERAFPDAISSRLTFAKQQVEEISDILESTASHFPAMLKLIGHRTPHRYLILLQNNDEIRATGGFIGSYAIVDVSDGEIVNLQVEDVYDIDGSFGGYVEPPEFLKDFTDNWRFRDSNYSPDFAVSGEKARWFLERQGGPGVDTVIGINQGLLKGLLEITGPVQVGRFGKLDAENYNLLLTYVIEGKVWGPEDPKHILKVFIPAFKEEILQEHNAGAIGSKLYRAVQQKHIMLYSPDSDIQALFDAFGLSGRVREIGEKEDYLSVINTSIGGTKSDKFVEENIRHETFIDGSGEIINELTIKRSHLWTDEIYHYWRGVLREYGFTEMPDQLIDILGRGRNKVNMRIYVPYGSSLIESDDENLIRGYDADLHKTYFLSIMEIRAGEVGTLNITYKPPFELDFNGPADTYRITIQKQPGSRGSILNKTILADESLTNLGYFPANARKDAVGRIIFATNLVYDRHFSAIWKR